MERGEAHDKGGSILEALVREGFLGCGILARISRRMEFVGKARDVPWRFGEEGVVTRGEHIRGDPTLGEHPVPEAIVLAEVDEVRKTLGGQDSGFTDVVERNFVNLCRNQCGSRRIN